MSEQWILLMAGFFAGGNLTLIAVILLMFKRGFFK